MSELFDFLKYCLGAKSDENKVIAGIDWQMLYSFASKQALLGLCFDGIERLGKEYPEELKLNPIGRELLMTWMGKAQQIRRQNVKVNGVAAKLYSKFTSNPQPIGFSGILLAKRQNSFYCTYFLHNRNVADTKSPYPIKRLEVIRWFNQKSMVFNQSLS